MSAAAGLPDDTETRWEKARGGGRRSGGRRNGGRCVQLGEIY